MGLGPLGNIVRGVAITRLGLLLLIALCVVWLRGLCEALGSRVECLRRQHGSIHEWGLVVWLHGSGVRLHARKLLVQEHVSHTMLGRNVVVQLAVEEPRRRLQVGVEPLVLSGQVVVFLFVHLFVDNILLGDAQSTPRSFLVNLRCSTRRLNPRLKAAVTAARCGNVRTATTSASIHNMIENRRDEGSIPLLVLFVSALRLHGLRSRKGASTIGRHSDE